MFRTASRAPSTPKLKSDKSDRIYLKIHQIVKKLIEQLQKNKNNKRRYQGAATPRVCAASPFQVANYSSSSSSSSVFFFTMN